MALFLVLPSAQTPREEMSRRLREASVKLRDARNLMDRLFPLEPTPSEALAIIRQAVAGLSPTTEVAPGAGQQHTFTIWMYLLLDSTFVQLPAILLQMANRLHRASRGVFPPISQASTTLHVRLSRADKFACAFTLPVAVPVQEYAHLNGCAHTYDPLAVFLYASGTSVDSWEDCPGLQCGDCSRVSQGAVFTQEPELSAQEKEALFREVLCQRCQAGGLNDGFHLVAEEQEKKEEQEKQEGEPEEQAEPEEQEEQEEPHLETEEESLPPPQTPPTSPVQEAGTDRLDDLCPICLAHLATHGSIAMLTYCGHVLGERCLHQSLGNTTGRTDHLGNWMPLECHTCRQTWLNALLFASTSDPEANLAASQPFYRMIFSAKVCCFMHMPQVLFHI